MSHPLECLLCCSKQSYVYNCIGCESFHLQPVGKFTENGKSLKFTPGLGPVVNRECDHCGRPFRVCHGAAPRHLVGSNNILSLCDWSLG
jgi:hypothetical protein